MKDEPQLGCWNGIYHYNSNCPSVWYHIWAIETPNQNISSLLHLKSKAILNQLQDQESPRRGNFIENFDSHDLSGIKGLSWVVYLEVVARSVGRPVHSGEARALVLPPRPRLERTGVEYGGGPQLHPLQAVQDLLPSQHKPGTQSMWWLIIEPLEKASWEKIIKFTLKEMKELYYVGQKLNPDTDQLQIVQSRNGHLDLVSTRTTHCLLIVLAWRRWIISGL